MPRILVVDDSEVDRRLLAGLLEDGDSMKVDFAQHGADALRQLEVSVPDVVVTDIHMPEVNGLELVTAAREKFPQLPFILVTAQGNEELAVKALQSGAASYVPKRLLAEELVETVRRILSVMSTEKNQAKLGDCRISQTTDYVLENDPRLVSSLVGHMQEEFARSGICDESDRMRVGIALEEALVNALYHGNLEVSSDVKERDYEEYQNLIDTRRTLSPYKERRLYVRVSVSRDEARVVIRDEGLGFDPRKVPDPTDPANLEKLSGRGLLLMRTFMDEVSHDHGGRQVTLVKRKGKSVA